MTERRIVIHKRWRKKLRHLKENEVVKEIALESGLIDDPEEDKPTYEDLLRIIIPEEADPMERRDEDLVVIDAQDMKSEIQDLAGENVPQSRVIRDFTESFIDQHEIEIED